MKLVKRLSLFVISIILVASVACGDKKKLRASVDSGEPRDGRDRELFQQALGEMKKKRYEQGRLLINTLVTTYGDSPLLPMAKLLIGDSYYREGGTSNLVQAEAEYKDWLQFFPNNELAPEVIIKMAEIHMRQVQTPDREPDHALQAEKLLLDVQRRFPKTKENNKVQEYSLEIQELLARHNFQIAKFYFERRNAYAATEGRCLEILNKYPGFTELDSVLWFMGRAREEQEDTEDAAKYFARLVREFPGSKYRDSAAERLEKFGKPVPDPDPNSEERIVEKRSMMGRMMENLFGPNLDISKEGILLKASDELDEEIAQRINKTSPSTVPQTTTSGLGDKTSANTSPTTTDSTNTEGTATIPKAKEKKKNKKVAEKSKQKSESEAKR